MEERSDGAGGLLSILSLQTDMSGGPRLAVSCCDGYEINSEKRMNVDSNDSHARGTQRCHSMTGQLRKVLMVSDSATFRSYPVKQTNTNNNRVL